MVDNDKAAAKHEPKVVDEPAVDKASKPAPVHTAEHWAEKHGQHVMRTKQRRMVQGSDVGTVERTNMKHRHYLEAKALHGWPEGKTMTEAEYLAAVKAATEVVYR